jgi:hypothetical protein
MTKTQEYQELFNQTIKNNDLYGLSFTYGRALERMIENGFFHVNDDDTWLIDKLENGIEAMTGIEGLSGHFTVETLSRMADIALLDEIARDMAGMSQS